MSNPNRRSLMHRIKRKEWTPTNSPQDVPSTRKKSKRGKSKVTSIPRLRWDSYPPT